MLFRNSLVRGPSYTGTVPVPVWISGIWMRSVRGTFYRTRLSPPSGRWGLGRNVSCKKCALILNRYCSLGQRSNYRLLFKTPISARKDFPCQVPGTRVPVPVVGTGTLPGTRHKARTVGQSSRARYRYRYGYRHRDRTFLLIGGLSLRLKVVTTLL